MLGTGVRIGEALAVLWNQINLGTGTVEITHTIARPPGEGLIRKTTKSRAGAVHAPSAFPAGPSPCCVTADNRPDAPVFPDTTGGYRDPSNTRRALRTALSPVGSTARRELGHTLRALRRQQASPQASRQILGWPQTRIELIETGRIKPNHRLVCSLAKAYGIDLDNTPDLLAQLRSDPARRIRQARLDPIPRTPQNHRHRPRPSRPHRPPNRRPTRPSQSLHHPRHLPGPPSRQPRRSPSPDAAHSKP